MKRAPIAGPVTCARCGAKGEGARTERLAAGWMEQVRKRTPAHLFPWWCPACAGAPSTSSSFTTAKFLPLLNEPKK